MGRNAIVGQSGGPTAKINSSLVVVFQAAQCRGAQHVYGMRYGVKVACWKNRWWIFRTRCG